MDPRPAPHVETRLSVLDEVDEDTYLAILDDVLSALSGRDFPFCFMGGLASSVYGRDRHTHDLDVFVRHADGEAALAALAAHGFGVERSEPRWIFKAAKRGLLVDLIFESSDGTTLEADVAERIRREEFAGRQIPVIPPEVLLLTKVSAFREDTAHQWFDCLGIIEHADLDWRYLLQRALPKPHRLTALLVWAQGNRDCVPREVLDELARAVVARPGGEAVA